MTKLGRGERGIDGGAGLRGKYRVVVGLDRGAQRRVGRWYVGRVTEQQIQDEGRALASIALSDDNDGRTPKRGMRVEKAENGAHEVGGVAHRIEDASRCVSGRSRRIRPVQFVGKAGLAFVDEKEIGEGRPARRIGGRGRVRRRGRWQCPPRRTVR